MKPIRHYEELFESLMQYTHFTSTSEIKTREDLTQFFKELKTDAQKRGMNKPSQLKFFKKRFVGRMVEALRSLHGTGVARERRKPQDIPAIKSYKARRAAGEGMRFSLPTEKGKVWKSTITKKGKQTVVWRNEKGQFTKAPK